MCLNSHEYLQDIYVNKNSAIDKDYGRGNETEPLMAGGIIFASSHDPKTHERRKALSGAFFKSKLIPISKVIRQVTLQVIKKWQQEGDRQLDLVKFTQDLQSRIIVTVLIGSEYQDATIEHEDKTGKLVTSSFVDFFLDLILYSNDRLMQPIMILVPELIGKVFTSQDRLWKRNIDRYERFVEQIGKKRIASGVEGADLLSIFNSFDAYKGNWKAIAQELAVFLFAGMRTVQFSTINTLYHLTKNRDAYNKLMAEVSPHLEAAKGDFVEQLDYDTVMDFDYLQCCWYESLRLDTVAEFSIPSTFNRDTTIGKGDKQITIPAGVQFFVHMAEMHNDPKEWPEPEIYNPERFNSKDPTNKWLLNSEGRPRNPMGFNPFFGGKRICLGKTFAEMTVRFTLPLILYHLDFEIPTGAREKPHMSANATTPELQMFLKVRNPVQ